MRGVYLRASQGRVGEKTGHERTQSPSASWASHVHRVGFSPDGATWLPSCADGNRTALGMRRMVRGLTQVSGQN